MSSTQESETGGSYINAIEAIPILQTAIEMGHPQGPTSLQFDNQCAHGILTAVLKQKQSKVIDMRFYWLCGGSIEQKQLHTHWKSGKQNLVDYPKRHHPDKQHRTDFPLYIENIASKFNESFATTNNQLQSVCKGVLNINTQRKWVI